MDEITIGRLASQILLKICTVCPDRNVDATCNRLQAGTCTLMAKLTPAAEAIHKVNSDQLEPYLQAVADGQTPPPDGYQIEVVTPEASTPD